MAQYGRTPIVKFGSHLPVLVKVLSITNGPVLEMGMGFNSSLVMHWLCAVKRRELVSYENSLEYWEPPFRAGKFGNEFHKVIYVDDWDKAKIERPWDVALIDHAPGERRRVEVKRLAQYAKYIVIHDSEGRCDKFQHYSEIYPFFKWKYDYQDYIPKTSVLSNFVDLTNFKVDL